ncbi:hypothetical protein KEM54_002968, partial [Ascosphaera aggregata]
MTSVEGPANQHEITTVPTPQITTTSANDYCTSYPWAPTPAGFFVVPSLFQKDFEDLANGRKTKDKGDADVKQAEMTVGTADVRLLIRNLEICAKHFGPHKPVMSAEKTIDVMLSCKEVLASLFRWRQNQDKANKVAGRYDLSSADPARNNREGFRILASHDLLGRADASQGCPTAPRRDNIEGANAALRKPMAAHLLKTTVINAEPTQAIEKITKTAKRCQNSVCAAPQLRKRCGRSRAVGISGTDKLCAICFPRNEAQINAYCASQSRREKAAFFLLAALVVLSVVVLAAVVFVKDMRRKRNAGKSEKKNGEVAAHHLPDQDITSETPPANRSGSWGAYLGKLRIWPLLQEMHWRMTRGKAASDVESAQESSFESFKAEEMLMSPFDYVPRTGKFYGSEQNGYASSPTKRADEEPPLHTPSALIKALIPPQLPPLK